MKEVRKEAGISVRRLATAFDHPQSSVGRFIKYPAKPERVADINRCPVSGNPDIIAKVKSLCEEEFFECYGHRLIHAHLKHRYGLAINRKTVLKIMRELGYTQPKVWHRPSRPKRMQKMSPKAPNQAWQIDMTSFQLTNLRTLYLVAVIDCYSRKIVGWTLDYRCRKGEWISAVRMALETVGFESKEQCRALTLRSDNGAQPCSKKFVEFLGSRGVRGEYTGYGVPDDNAYVERVIRTVKQERIWLNRYDTFDEAHESIEKYIEHYNGKRLHSALDYQIPNEVAANNITLNAA